MTCSNRGLRERGFLRGSGGARRCLLLGLDELGENAPEVRKRRIRQDPQHLKVRILIERPFVVTGKGTRLARPIDKVREIL